MSEDVRRFLASIDGRKDLSAADLIDTFAYYITVIMGRPAASRKAIASCFEVCDLPVPSRLARYLSENVSKKPPRYIKVPDGYRLQLDVKEAVGIRIGAEKVLQQTSVELRDLEHKIPNGSSRLFLRELIDCFEVGANRAAIVMCWLLAVDHMYSYIIKHQVTAFNGVLSTNTDKRVKISSINVRDDFSEIPESKFIEFCRAAGIISNDVRKILDGKLGIRNSAAHPSRIEVSRSKAIEFIEDLVSNIILKYKI